MVIRELVTKLSYSIDKSKLIEYKQSASKVAKSIPQLFQSATGSSFDKIKQMSQQARNSVKLNAQKARELMRVEREQFRQKSQYQREFDRAKRTEQRNRLSEYRELFNQIKRNAIAEKNAIKDIEAQRRRKISNASAVASTTHNIGVGATAVGAGITAVPVGIVAGGISALTDMQANIAKFSAMLKSDEKGVNFQSKVEKFALNTPLNQQAVERVSASLLSIGFKEDELLKEMTKIGDVSLGNNELFNRIANQYGQVIAMGKPSLEELRALGEAGVPLIKKMAENLGVQESQIFAMSDKGLLTKEIFVDAFDAIAKEREGAMSKQMTMLGGQIDLLTESVVLALRDFAIALLPEIMFVIGTLRKVVDGVRALPNWIKKGIVHTLAITGIITTIMGATLLILSLVANINRLLLSMEVQNIIAGLAGGGLFGKVGKIKGAKDVVTKGSTISRVRGFLSKNSIIYRWFQRIFSNAGKKVGSFGGIISKVGTFMRSLGTRASSLLVRLLPMFAKVGVVLFTVLEPLGLVITAFTLLHEAIFKLIPWLERPMAGDTYKKGKMLHGTAASIDQFYYKNAENKNTGVLSSRQLDINVVANLEMPEGSTQYQKAYLKKIASETFKSELESQFFGLKTDTVGSR